MGERSTVRGSTAPSWTAATVGGGRVWVGFLVGFGESLGGVGKQGGTAHKAWAGGWVVRVCLPPEGIAITLSYPLGVEDRGGLARAT
jgi:hypothetical protein